MLRPRLYVKLAFYLSVYEEGKCRRQLLSRKFAVVVFFSNAHQQFQKCLDSTKQKGIYLSCHNSDTKYKTGRESKNLLAFLLLILYKLKRLQAKQKYSISEENIVKNCLLVC